MKISPVRAQLFHAQAQTDGQTDMTNLRVALRNFGKVTKMVNFIVSWQLEMLQHDRNSQFVHNTVTWLSIGHELRSAVECFPDVGYFKVIMTQNYS